MRLPLRTHGYRAAATLALACALTATTQQAARADPTTLTEVRARLQSLYHDAEVATDKYNAADVKVTAQKKKRVGTLNAQVHTTEAKLARLTTLAGAAARAQYRGGGVPAELQFAFASDPGRALDNAGLALQAQQNTQNLLTDLTATRENLRTRTDDAASELKRLQTSRRAMDTERKKIEQHITAAQTLESRLAAKERQRLAALDRQDADKAQAKWESTGILKKVGTDATAAGRKAIAYATRQLGKPYVWGAEGPDSFDCSGLTSQAWLAAGRRDSPHVGTAVGAAEARPGRGHASRRPHHLLLRREPCGHLHRGRGHHLGAQAGAGGVCVTGGVDADPRGGAAGRVNRLWCGARCAS